MRWVTAKLVACVGVTVGALTLGTYFFAPVESARTWLLVNWLLAAAAAGLVSHRCIHRPLSQLEKACRRITGGDYDHPIRPDSTDEIGALAASLEQMRRAIKSKAVSLDEAAARFQTLFEQVPCYVTVQDSDFRLVAFNKRFEDDFGHHVGERCHRVFKNRDSICPDCAVEKTFRDGKIHSAEETVIGRDGSVMHFLNLTAPIFDAQGNIQSVMEMATDVTPVRRLEAELIDSERKHRLFFNNDPNSILILDRDDLTILDHNDRAGQLYDQENLAGTSFLKLAQPREAERIREFIAAGEYLLPRVHMVRHNGQTFIANLRASHWYYNGKPAVILSAVDITTWMETENQLIQAGKMATLGEMSAGVAHELNQPLTVIGAGAGFLSKQVRRNRKMDAALILEVAEEIKGQVDRATKIINHLREFGRKSDVERTLVDLAKPIRGVFHLLGRQLEVHDIEVKLDLADNLPPVLSDSNRLEQVFINLVINARDAIESRLAEDPNGEPGRIEIRVRAAGDSVTAVVSDNGTGMTQEKISRIFEPFYTTKPVGKGAGLGLSISYGIIRDYDGAIDVDSAPGRGTSFKITLPAARKETDVRS